MIALEAAEVRGPGPVPAEAERIAARRPAVTVDPKAFPRTHAAADAVAAHISTGQFRWGLARALTGLVQK